MTEPADAKFAPTHEWVRIKGDELLLGASDYVPHHLDAIIHVELPEPDDHHYEAGEDFLVLESLEGAMDLHAPVAGTVIEVNNLLHHKPELINEDPYGAGWLLRMKPDNMKDVEHLMAYHEYEVGLPPDHDEHE
ncbi:MAG: glycine cleavage system protein GcvH [Verrucomicrobia bacterium]|nr:glycine cleavage system protein GcvH [Verrucomicrobiota bacterium]MBT7068754.1 glycine cleavage system protein GcvH [Verrucomicrobiota bacterium]MBT7698877.1 glycine cleavage system protein GcvH [Verrucomicrobiota bacterium]